MNERIIPINLKSLAVTALVLCDCDRQIITVGTSATDITGFWPQSLDLNPMTVTALTESRRREERVLTVQELNLEGPRYFVDDVAVSGLTLEAARRAVSPGRSDDVALVGLAWKSRRMQRRVGMELRSAAYYQQEGGGRPAINSLSTLATKSDLRREYALRKFGDSESLENIIKIYAEADR